jgi:hypothetical protein
MQDKPCKDHPDAPHGFMRDASHSAGRYVCECESWEPPKEEQKPVAYITGFHSGHCIIQPIDRAVVLPVGMTLRDYFAAKAMQALAQKYSHEGDISRNAYKIADAMLKAREA